MVLGLQFCVTPKRSSSVLVKLAGKGQHRIQVVDRHTVASSPYHDHMIVLQPMDWGYDCLIDRHTILPNSLLNT